ncbi:MAG: citrate (Si)-synthase, partial [bacterium]|nr:citrate (Si)-synthase [bacterium]
MSLYDKLKSQVDELRSTRKQILTEHGDHKISDVNVKQAFGGMRGIKGMICDTSVVEPDKGLIIRGYPLLEIADRWPEDIFYLLCTGDLPTEEDVQSIRKDFADRAELPGYVIDVLKAMPKDSHPMAMLDTGVLVMQRESQFYKKYQAGMAKTEYWEPMLEDSLKLLAVLPAIAGAV